MAVLDGGGFRVKIDSTVVAYATSSTINLSTQMEKVAATSSGASSWQNVTPGRKKANLNTNALYGTSTNKDFEDLWNAWVNSTSVSIEFGTFESGEWKMAGTAYIATLSATGAVSQDATARATFEFTGAVTLSTVSGSDPETLLTDDTGTTLTDDTGTSPF